MKCSCESCEVFLLGPPEGTLGWVVVIVVVVVEYSMIGGGPSERTGKEVGPLNAITLPPGVQIIVSSVSELSAIRLLQSEVWQPANCLSPQNINSTGTILQD